MVEEAAAAKAVDGADTDARATYRALRISMVALVLLLAVSIVELARRHGHVEGSISAYYYTEAHGVFIAALCALGICLIAYKGHTVTEDVLLDVSGILAFVVALVPTKGEHIRYPALPTTSNASIGVENNIFALLIAVLLGFVIYGIYASFGKWRGGGNAGTSPPPADSMISQALDNVGTLMDRRPWLTSVGAAAKWLLLATPVVLTCVGGYWFLRDLAGFTEHAHGRAATVMFIALAVVVLHYAVYALRRVRHGTSHLIYAVLYAVAGLTMIVTGALAFCAYRRHPGGDLTIFWYEVALLAAFSAFWLIQTWDLWTSDWYAQKS
ncbi:MAG: hypothetical protein HYZ38_20890 [Mycobacterium sp.]|nr:hypothetical protein [Mycobacterium sp.]